MPHWNQRYIDASGNDNLDNAQLKEVAALIVAEPNPAVLDMAMQSVRDFMVDEPELWKAIKGHMNSENAEIRGRIALNIIIATGAKNWTVP